MSLSKSENHRSNVGVVEAGPYRIIGISVAAVETCIWVPSISLAIDAGKSPMGAIPMQYMAITHGHCDHVHGMPLHVATRALQRLPPATYFVPPAIADDVNALVKATGRLEQSNLHANIVPLKPGGDMVDLGKGWCLASFDTYHTVPSQGYIVYQRRKKLRPQYVDMPREEIASLRRSGVDIQNEILSPEIAFTGDSTIEAIQRCSDCRKARVLVTEMTFIDNERTAEHAHKLGHIHLDDIISNTHLFADNQYVIFSHFSARYSKAQILEAFNRFPDELRKKSYILGINLRDQ